MSEKEVRIKRRKLLCAVKNCRERDSQYITKSGDFQNTPDLCDDCLEKAFNLISERENTPNGVVDGKVYTSGGTGKKIRAKHKKLLCDVKGCASRTSWYISKGNDFGGSPNICFDCLKKAYAKRFQNVDLSGVTISYTPYESDGAAVPDGHPTKSEFNTWEFPNPSYYEYFSLFKAGDVVALTVSVSTGGIGKSFTLNGAETKFESGKVITIPKTVLKQPISFTADLGAVFTITIDYADLAGDSGVSTHAELCAAPVYFNTESAPVTPEQKETETIAQPESGAEAEKTLETKSAKKTARRAKSGAKSGGDKA